MSIFITSKIQKHSVSDNTIESRMIDLQNIKTGFDGDVMNWRLKKLEMNELGFWSVVVDFIQNFEFEGISYKIAVVLDPSNHNQNCKRIIEKFNNQQQEIFKNAEDYIAELQKVHDDYESQSKLFGTFVFHSQVKEFKDNMKADKVVFSLGSEAVEHFTKHSDVMHKTVLILEAV